MNSTLIPELTNAARSHRSGSPLAFPDSANEFDLVGLLLEQQQTLSAVEAFSKAHDTGQLDQPAQAFYYRRLMPATPPGAGQQLAFEVNMDSCSGCKACVVACHTLNGLEENESWRKVGTLTIGVTESEPDIAAIPTAISIESSPVSIGGSGVQHVTTACHHCEDPGCLSGCPVKAYVKDDATGIVRHLDDQCIGCKYCTMMCPYEVPQYSKRLGIVRKCDMCHQRLKTGEAPACVQSCPSEAIAIRVVDASEPIVDQTSRLMPGAPGSTITRPTTRYVTKRDAQIQSAVPQDHAIDEVAESHWPLALMLVATQVAVGMILLERIVAGALFITGGSLPLEATRLTASVALVIAVVGLNLASLHLGQPLRAWRVFLGLRTSWLSREAVLLGKFVAALGTAVLLMWWPVLSKYVPSSLHEIFPQSFPLPAWAGSAALLAAIVLGIAGLYSSAMIYIVTRRKLWRTARTLPRFAATGVVVGAALTAFTIHLTTTNTVADPARVQFSIAERASEPWPVQLQAPAAVLILLLVAALSGAAKLFWEWPVYLKPIQHHSQTQSLDDRCRRVVSRRLSGWRQLRLFSGMTGLFAVAMAFAAIVTDASSAALWWLVVGAIGLMVGEATERLLYFMSVVYDRMPGTLK